jgi:hypothetical protein
VSKEIEKVVLNLHVQSDDFVSRETLSLTDMAGVQPKEVNVQGVVYHRYGDDDNFIDVKPELVVLRSVKTIYKDKPDGGPRIVKSSRSETESPEPADALDREKTDGT